MMSGIGKKSFLVESTIDMGVQAELKGSVKTFRNGSSVEVNQRFLVPKRTLICGDILVHKVSNKTFVVQDVLPSEVILRGFDGKEQYTLDIRTVKQSCWLLAETTEESR